MRRIAVWLFLLLAFGAMASADVVVCKDGRRFSGEVSISGGTYTIRTKFGVATVDEYEVEKHIRDDGATQPAPATRPTTAPAETTPRDPAIKPIKPTTAKPDATRPSPNNGQAPPRTSRPASWKPDPSRPKHTTRYAAAFPVAGDLLVTSAAALDDAADVALQGADGFAIKATVVQKDSGSGLALLRAPGQKFKYFALEDKFAGGDVSCPAYAQMDLFEPRPDLLKAKTPAPGGNWSAKFDKHPNLPGSPLLAGDRVVGVELAKSNSPADHIPAATLEQLRKFCGDRPGPSPTTFADPCSAMYQLVVTAATKPSK